MKKWSSQWIQCMQLRKEAWKKKFRTSMGFEPVTLRLPVRCSTNWAMKPLTLGAGQLWVHMFPWKTWVLMIYEINHIWTAEMKWKWRNDRRSKRNLCNCVKSRSIGHVYSWSHDYCILLSSYSILTISFVSLKIIMLPYYMHESYFCHKAKVPVPREGVKKFFSFLDEFHMLPTDTNIILLFYAVSVLTEHYTWLEKEVLYLQH